MMKITRSGCSGDCADSGAQQHSAGSCQSSTWQVLLALQHAICVDVSPGVRSSHLAVQCFVHVFAREFLAGDKLQVPVMSCSCT